MAVPCCHSARRPCLNSESKLSLAQPHRGQVRVGTASAGHWIDTHYSFFAAITLRPLHAQLVKSFEILPGDGWYGSSFFCRLDEDSEGLQPVKLLIPISVTTEKSLFSRSGQRLG
jgi:hypothetical protein